MISQSLPPRRVDEIDWTSWEPLDKATLLFVVRGDEILLIRKRRGLGAGKINGPGGRIEDGESALEAALREVEEEIGIAPLEASERGQLSFQFVDGYSIHVRVFRASACHGEPRETDEAIPLWTKTDHIPYPEMWADDRIWLPLLLDDQHFAGRFIFDGDEMLDHEVEVLDSR